MFLPQLTHNSMIKCVVNHTKKQQDNPCDIILVQDSMRKIGPDLCFGTGHSSVETYKYPRFLVATAK